ncbi:MAG: DNA mismatch repair protein MutS [Candidatus Dojkabacteria bacterium]|nr:MAG: DNA mismatch repair protein MutS [Candidatus Dojkabacteria bacterium]
MKKTPMMEQYLGVKRQYPDKIVLFRMGDFYETFGDDAKLASKVLNITLTTRDKATDPTPLAGFPHHALDQYLPKIIKSGHSAVVVDQLEDPKLAKGVVKRGVTRVVTPGTLDGDLADSRKNPYVMAVVQDKEKIGVAFADLSTGEFKITEIPLSRDSLNSLIAAHDPVEILLPDSETSLKFNEIPVQLISAAESKPAAAEKTLKEFYKAKSLDSLFIADYKLAARAASMLISYILDTQKMNPEHISRPQYFSTQGTMVLDRATIRNLDLVQNSYTGQSHDTLLEVLDDTRTVMGRRMLYSWVINPLLNLHEINERHEVVEYFHNDFELLNEIRKLLSEVSDTERIVGKVGLNRASARDLKGLQLSLQNMLQISDRLAEHSELLEKFKFAQLFSDEKLPINSLITRLDSTISDSPPTTISEGGIVKAGYSPEVDELRSLAGSSNSGQKNEWVQEMVEVEKAKTGIPSLKIGFNKVFGYYIEVTNAHIDKVPGYYIRKQTLVNCERFITDELKKKEEVILGAEERLFKLEYNIFQELREELLPYLTAIKQLSHETGKLDVLAGFANIARSNLYIKPIMHDFGVRDGVLKIAGGRHPVVEKISDDEFVSNDVDVTIMGNRMAIITGPNMSGKSTYIRQIALIVLMAQIGSFVPANDAEISLVDRVFSRVGASDNLSQGRSTFMVEMEEAANILNNATENSLVILDEVGRGTSTYDGVSIAWALSEYLVSRVKARTLFATHYHELLKLAAEHPEFVRNYNVMVSEDEEKGEVTFMRKIVEGGTDRSYGIYVAQLAGLPEEVVTRANEILSTLSNGKGESDDEQIAAATKGKSSKAASIDQLSFFSAQESELINELKGLDLDGMTPVEALNKLVELKRRFE